MTHRLEEDPPRIVPRRVRPRFGRSLPRGDGERRSIPGAGSVTPSGSRLDGPPSNASDADPVVAPTAFVVGESGLVIAPDRLRVRRKRSWARTGSVSPSAKAVLSSHRTGLERGDPGLVVAPNRFRRRLNRSCGRMEPPSPRFEARSPSHRSELAALRSDVAATATRECRATKPISPATRTAIADGETGWVEPLVPCARRGARYCQATRPFFSQAKRVGPNDKTGSVERRCRFGERRHRFCGHAISLRGAATSLRAAARCPGTPPRSSGTGLRASRSTLTARKVERGVRERALLSAGP